MRRQCAPLYDTDKNEYCGAWFDDLYRMAVCPHNPLAGGEDPLPPSTLPPRPEVIVTEGIDPDLFGTVCDERDVALAEIQRLRAWKQETITVMDHWHALWMTVPHGLGSFQWDDVRAEIERLKSEMT